MTNSLLDVVLAGRGPAATEAWNRWWPGKDLDTMGWPEAQLLVMLDPTQRRRWLRDDPAAPRVEGLVRRAWTEAGLRVRLARELAASLAAAQLGPVILAGPAAAFLTGLRRGAVRPVTEIHLLLPRSGLDRAVAHLARLGWQLTWALPTRPCRSWSACVGLRRGADVLRLGWRHVQPPPWRTQVIEKGLFAAAPEMLPAEELILSLLCPGAVWDGVIPWEADLAFLADPLLDWQRVLTFGMSHDPVLLARLRTLRGRLVGIPELVSELPWLPRMEGVVARRIRSLFLYLHHALPRR